MQISLGIQQNQSQWNKFRTTFSDEKFYFGYDVLVDTTQLGVFSLNSKRKQRLKLIYDLHTQGWSNKKISDYLNSKNLKTPRTRKEFTPKLIWMTIHRYQKRLTRKSNRILRNGSLKFLSRQQILKNI